MEKKGWLDLAGKLVWPLFIGILIIVFRSESSELYSILKERIQSGAPVKLGSFFELGEQASKTEVSELLFHDLPIEAIGGPAEAVRKASGQTLQRLQEGLKQAPYKRVDTLLVDNGISYSPSLLKDYVNTLGIRFVVFRQTGRFDGWIEAGVFLSQLLSRLNLSDEELKHKILPYNELKSDIVGISTKTVQAKDTVRNVLQAMQEGHTDNLPVLNGKDFRFFANRGEILANLISNFILKKENEVGKDENSGSSG